MPGGANKDCRLLAGVGERDLAGEVGGVYVRTGECASSCCGGGAADGGGANMPESDDAGDATAGDGLDAVAVAVAAAGGGGANMLRSGALCGAGAGAGGANRFINLDA